MEESWNNLDRIGAINQALYKLPHDQEPIGMGFKLRHNPTTCIRCRATIAILELGRIIYILENGEPEIGEEIKRGEVVPIDS